MSTRRAPRTKHRYEGLSPEKRALREAIDRLNEAPDLDSPSGLAEHFVQAGLANYDDFPALRACIDTTALRRTFARWMKEGAEPELLRRTIDAFFDGWAGLPENCMRDYVARAYDIAGDLAETESLDAPDNVSRTQVV